MEIFKNNKLITWGIFALVTLIVMYYLGSRSGKAKNTGTKGFKDEITKNALTYDLSQYSGFADRLESAMFGFTDDEEAVYDVFSKLRNKSDLLQLINIFGSRRIMTTIGGSSLPIWINNRLDKSEIQRVNEILSRNNIDYTF